MWIKIALLIALGLGSAIAYGNDEYSSPPPPPSPPSSMEVPDTADISNQKAECRKKWAEFYRSQACFAPYRLANGSVRAEAFRHCKAVPQPEFCE